MAGTTIHSCMDLACTLEEVDEVVCVPTLESHGEEHSLDGEGSKKSNVKT